MPRALLARNPPAYAACHADALARMCAPARRPDPSTMLQLGHSPRAACRERAQRVGGRTVRESSELYAGLPRPACRASALKHTAW